MKRIINFLSLLTVLSIALSGCGNITAKQQATADTTQQARNILKDTPHQVGQKGTMSTSLIEGFDFNKTFKKADIIAEVTILEWLGEVTDEFKLETTTFRAELNKTFKSNEDNNLKEINIMQTGNSYYTIENSPLFKNGDKLILYLEKAEKEDGYFILGEQTGIFRIINAGKGKDYAVKQVGNCPQLADAKITENTAIDKIRNTLAKSYTIEYSNLDKNGLPETYDLVTMEYLIKEQKNK